jgi:TrmH family RNA methyltransferase
VEGAVLLGEAVAGGAPVEAVYVADPEALEAVTAIAPGAEVRVVRAEDLARIGSTVHPQPVVAVVRLPTHHLESLARPTLVVVAAGVADPGNLGTIVRSAEAAGADAVVTTPGTVDAWSPKVVRASAGAVFHLPVVVDADPAAIAALDLTRLAAVAHGGRDHDLVDLTGPVALVLGNEAHGLDGGHGAVAVDDVVTIRHTGRAESLNVAMAATVLLFEAARQRRRGADAAGTAPISTRR